MLANKPKPPPPPPNTHYRQQASQYWKQPNLVMVAPGVFFGPAASQHQEHSAPMLFYGPAAVPYWEQRNQGMAQYARPADALDAQTPAAAAAAAQNQNQFQPSPFPVLAPPAPLAMTNNGAMWMPPEGANLRPIGLLNGELVYEVAGPSTSASQPPSPNTPKTKKRKAEEQLEAEQPSAKRSPNALKPFGREHGSKLVAESKTKKSAVANGVLGQRRPSLTSAQQAPYLQQPPSPRRLHQQPDVSSCRANARKKRKREKVKPAKATPSKRSREARPARKRRGRRGRPAASLSSGCRGHATDETGDESDLDELAERLMPKAQRKASPLTPQAGSEESDLDELAEKLEKLVERAGPQAPAAALSSGRTLSAEEQLLQLLEHPESLLPAELTQLLTAESPQELSVDQELLELLEAPPTAQHH